MVEVGEETWRAPGRDVRRARRQPLGGDALAALRHLASRRRSRWREAGRVEGAIGWAYAPRSASPSSTWASTTSPTCSPGRAGGRRRRASRWPSRSYSGPTEYCSAWRGSRAGSFPAGGPRRLGERRRSRRDAAAHAPAAGADARRGPAAAGRDLLPLPEAGRARRRDEQARRRRADLDRDRDRLQRRLLRDLHRPLQSGGRRRRAAADLARDLRDQHGRGGGDAALLGRRRRRRRAHLLGAAQSRDARAATSPAGWSPSSPSTTPSTRWR